VFNAQVACPQTAAPPAAAPAAATADEQSPVFKEEQLDQILAPIALYPDQLLAQILMAASYPLEIVQAERWVRKPENAKLKGDQLASALEKQTWDPSVKSLVPFRQVLEMMSENLDWTQKLGDAVLAQQRDVMASVQRLRKAAQSAGNLKTTEQQTVKTEDTAIIIEPANPQIVYVPAYDTQVVYGTWPYPSYPPTYYPPPPAYYPYYGGYPYYPFGGALAFAAGIAIVGSIWGWGNCNWGGGGVYVDHRQYNNINRSNINAGRASQLPAGTGKWRHDPGHRGGVAYRDRGSRQNFQRASQLPANSRQNFRGFDNGGRPGAGNRPGQGGPSGSRPGGGGGAGVNRPSTLPSRGGGIGASRPSVGGGAAATRPATRPTAPAFSGMGSGSSANFQADRGRASRGSMSAPRSGGYASGASVGGGRGGGGFGGGGGRGGGRR
jgi:hypothetical protein